MAKQNLRVIRGTVIQDGERYTAGSDNDELSVADDKQAKRLINLGVCESIDTAGRGRGSTPRNPGTPPSGDTAA